MANLLGRLFPPTFDKFDVIVQLLVETLQMAVVDTVLGYIACRWVLNVLRSIPDLIFALMFVSAVGLGPFAGILAIVLGSVGSIGKVYAEAMESVQPGPVEALTAVGANKPQIVAYEVLPQTLPYWSATPSATPEQVGTWYAGLVESQARQLALGLTLVAMGEGATVFHCAAGKDRTGVFAAVVLSALGASPETISADYAETATRLPRLFPRLRAIMGGLLPDVMPAEGTPGAGNLGAMMGAHAASMDAMQAVLIRRHGSVLEPVRQAGLSDGLIEELRGKLVADD